MADVLHPEDRDRTPLERLRRNDMYKFANAFGIQYPPNCTKNQLLPLVQVAIQSGMAGPGVEPVNPDALLTAGERRRKRAEKKPENVGAYAKWRGPKYKWCAMDGDLMLEKGFDSKEFAEEWLKTSSPQ